MVVKVDTVGICGSDVHLTQGLFPGEPPRILGHEFSGVIVETGPEVDESIRGRGVVAIPTWVCGDCAGCRAGMRNICADPLRTFGLAEYAVMPEYNALQIPPGPRSPDSGANGTVSVLPVGPRNVRDAA